MRLFTISNCRGRGGREGREGRGGRGEKTKEKESERERERKIINLNSYLLNLTPYHSATPRD